MRIVEYQHRAEGGGNDVHLDNKTWAHGELVLIVPKHELRDLLGRLAIALATTSEEKLHRDVCAMVRDIDKL